MRRHGKGARHLCPADRAEHGATGRLKDACSQGSRRIAVGAEEAPIVDPTRTAVPQEERPGRRNDARPN